MWRVALLLTGCNAVFGIKETRQYDAAYFDAPPDAPFTCPALGGPAPVFSQVLHQDLIQNCSTYRERAGLVVGQCTNPTTFLIENLAGTLHQPLTMAGGVPQSDFNAQESYDELHPGSDGHHVYLRHGSSGVYGYEEWAVGSDGQWSLARTLPMTGYSPIYDAYADRVLIEDSQKVAFDEYTLDGTLAYQHTADEMGLVGVIAFDVSDDGLRAFIIGVAAGASNKSSVYYTDRPALDMPFSPVRVVANIPSINELSVAEDCSRFYFPALGSILYLQQN